EGELVGELDVDLGIGLIAARRHVEVMHYRGIAQARLLAECHPDMPAVGLAAEIALVDRVERYARDDRDAVVALLPVERDVVVAEPRETLARKLVVRALGLLQAEHVRPLRLDELRHQIDAQPHGIYVP